MNIKEQISASSPIAEVSKDRASLLVDGQALSPQLNMALDAWLAECSPLVSNQAILRIYRWSPAGISIGRNQSWERAIDIGSLSAGEIAVRRVTGGRAIYHDTDELTYSFVTKISEMQPDVEPSKRSPESADPIAMQRQISNLIAEALLCALKSAGIDAKIERRAGYVPAHRSKLQSPHCFVSSARYELTVRGMKVVASAQRVSSGRYFQHGSIKLMGAVSHSALFGRYERKVEQKGNNLGSKWCYSKERYTTERGAALSSLPSNSHTLDPHYSNPHTLDPEALRSAFAAVLGSRVVAPSLEAGQWEEVLRLMADNDSIVGDTVAGGTVANERVLAEVAADERPISQSSRPFPHNNASQ